MCPDTGMPRLGGDQQTVLGCCTKTRCPRLCRKPGGACARQPAQAACRQDQESPQVRSHGGASPSCPQLCQLSHQLLPPFPVAPWVSSSARPLLGVSGLLCIPATTHTEGHIYNANVRLAQENRVHPTHPCVCRLLLARTQAAESRHPRHHTQPLVSTASN